MTEPLSRRDAEAILADPARWADRPSLVALARMVAASALGHTVTQRRRAAHRPARPALRVIDGGRADEAPR